MAAKSRPYLVDWGVVTLPCLGAEIFTGHYLSLRYPGASLARPRVLRQTAKEMPPHRDQ
jgi:hypothetical protein